MPLKTLKRVMARKFETIGDAVCAALMETEANYSEIAGAGEVQRAHVEGVGPVLRSPAAEGR